MALDSQTIKGFVQSCLQRKFDRPVVSPKCHEEWWDLCCSEDKQIAIAAPREHAKSTAITLSFVLAAVLFRQHQFVLIVSDTEGQSTLFLGDIKQELIENEDIISLLRRTRPGFSRSSEMWQRYTSRIPQTPRAKGAEQRL